MSARARALQVGQQRLQGPQGLQGQELTETTEAECKAKGGTIVVEKTSP